MSDEACGLCLAVMLALVLTCRIVTGVLSVVVGG